MLQKVYCLDHWRYHSEYFNFLLDRSERFAVVETQDSGDVRQAIEREGLTQEVFDPQLHRIILTNGRVMDPTAGNFLLMRYLHSPGFGLRAWIDAYAHTLYCHSACNFRFVMPIEAYLLLSTTTHLSDGWDRARDAMLNDSRISTTEVNHMLCWLRDQASLFERKAGTVLVALNWNVGLSELARWDELIAFLCRGYEVTVVFHPLSMPQFIAREREQGRCKQVLANLPRSQMIGLYDSHEFIVSDGSGSCYEALLRGCTPLLVEGFNHQKQGGLFYVPIQEGYLPFASYTEISSAGHPNGKEVFETFFSSLKYHTQESAEKTIHDEIQNLLPNEWA